LKKLSYTGEPIDSGDRRVGRTDLRHVPVCSIYGTTEVGVIMANYPGADDLPVKPGALGKPVPGLEVQFSDRAGQPCAPGAIGEIMLRRGDRLVSDQGSRVISTRTVTSITCRPRRRRDHLRRLDHERGRDREHPAQASGRAECAVIGVPDATRGQVVKAFVVTTRAAQCLHRRDSTVYAQQRLSQHEFPRQVEFVSELPKTPAGKVTARCCATAKRLHSATASNS
jgi:acetyl-CoA synthetase